jgi:hypothetical protein
MAFKVHYSEEKNQLLKAIRGVGFDDILDLIKNGNLLDDKVHPHSSRKHQRLYVVKVDEYAYVVPYVINKEKNEIFLKTLYPSRKYTNLYIKKGNTQ